MITWTNVTRKLGELQPWPRNPRQIKSDQARRLAESFDTFGQVETIAIGPDNEVYNGHQRLNVLMAQHGRDYVVECRQASRALTEKEREKLTVFLHKGAAGEWDFDILANEFEVDDLLEWGFEAFELGLDGLEDEDSSAGADVEPQIDKAEELRVKWGVESGQLWQLGEHRLICGDCTDKAVVERVMGGELEGAVIIDPPYSSGGFQEAGKSNGSIGTRSSETIQRDNLSTRGYRLLLIDALANFGFADSLYIFTDWRMWIECYDVSERSGWRVRSMLVWDKEQMGMGLPWRSQHELILYGKQTPAKMLDGKCGNVLKASRTGNKNHPTEKPVELITQLMGNTPEMVFIDFFSGSGTTLIACEQLGRKCRAIEISPAYVAVALQRWADHTGRTPVRVE